MILGIDKFNTEEKELLCEMLSLTRQNTTIEVDPEWLGIYKMGFVQKAVTEQEQKLNEDGVKVLQSILSKIQGQ
jgi:hypothetical protein